MNLRHYYDKSRVAYFENCAYREYVGIQNPETVLIFLHGFPADSGKNEDVAQNISISEGFTTYIFEYAGLGNSRGNFSLTNSIIESELFIRHLIKSKVIKRLIVVGHSWGGLVTINLIGNIQEISEAILLAPFVILPEENNARTILLDFISYEKEIRNKQYCIEKLMEEFHFIKSNCAPLQKLETIKKRKIKLSIIQGDADDVCPLSGALELQQKAGDSAKLICVPAGHWFESRIQLLEAVQSIVRSKL